MFEGGATNPGAWHTLITIIQGSFNYEIWRRTQVQLKVPVSPWESALINTHVHVGVEGGPKSFSTGLTVCALANGDQLAAIAGLVVKGTVKVNVETVLPLPEARKAQELSKTGHSGGKIVLEVNGRNGRGFTAPAS